MSARFTILLVIFAALALIPGVRGQQTDNAVTPAPQQLGHKEVPRDPYVPVAPEQRVTSPAARPVRNGYVSIQVNVDEFGNNIVGDAANEPSIAIDPTNPDRMVIGWRQFDTIQSDFRQAGWGYSHDGGQTWTFPGVVDPGVFRSDPVLDSDSSGNFYFNSLSTNWSDFWCHVFKSGDGGVSWDSGTYAYGGDKQWMVIDRTGGVGDGNIYANWTFYYSICYPGHFTRSYDGGQTYLSCTTVPNNPYWGTLAVGPDGELYVCGDGFVVAKSSNIQYQGQTPVWDFSKTVSLGGSLVFGSGPNPGGLLGQVWIAVDCSNGPTRGNVYLLCSVDPPGSDPMDVMFSRSTDGGQTWSSPIRINDDPVGNGAWQWFGTLSVAPNGRIDVIWNDTRNDPGGYDSELYYSYSEDGGLTWSPNEALSPPFNPHLGWPQQNKLGDYYDMISYDDCAHIAYAATFNGEQDIYYLRTKRLLGISFPNGLPDILPPGEPAEITVQISPGVENYIPGSGTLYYRYQGATFQPSPLQPLGGELYLATLPPPGCDDEPHFYFSAEGDQSGVVYQPPGAPAQTFSALVGVYTVIFHDDFEEDLGWVAENLGATSGDWERGVPVNDPNWAYDPISDSDGSGQCYLTENDFGNTDVDDGAVRLTSPTIDMSGGNVTITYDYYLYLTNTTGGVDRLLVEINSNNGVGPWIEIARHDTNGGLSWRSHTITQADLDAAGVAVTETMKLRFTANDADPQSIVEAGLDAFMVSSITCEEFEDCNGNGVPDHQDIADGTSSDVNGNGIPDECETIGDLNCDGSVDGFDIQAFVLAVTDPDAYQAQYPNCDINNADCNGDGQVDGFDIQPFVVLLTWG